MAKKQREEHEQIALFTWAAIHEDRYPELALIHHIPNGGKRTKTEAAQFKRAGVKAGIPDIFLPAAREEYHGLYIEMKVGKNEPTEEQCKMIRKLNDQYYCTVICYSVEEAVDVIESYLSIHEYESADVVYHFVGRTDDIGKKVMDKINDRKYAAIDKDYVGSELICGKE